MFNKLYSILVATPNDDGEPDPTELVTPGVKIFSPVFLDARSRNLRKLIFYPNKAIVDKYMMACIYCHLVRTSRFYDLVRELDPENTYEIDPTKLRMSYRFIRTFYIDPETGDINVVYEETPSKYNHVGYIEAVTDDESTSADHPLILKLPVNVRALENILDKDLLDLMHGADKLEATVLGCVQLLRWC